MTDAVYVNSINGWNCLRPLEIFISENDFPQQTSWAKREELKATLDFYLRRIFTGKSLKSDSSMMLSLTVLFLINFNSQ